MKARPIASALVLALSLGGGMAIAQTAPDQSKPPAAGVTTPPATASGAVAPVPASTNPAGSASTATPAWYDALYATDLIGKDVHDSTGDEIAEIENIVFDANEGKLFAIVSTGGFLGIGGKDVSVSLAELRRNGENDVVLPTMSEAELKTMPEYSQGTHAPVQGYQRLGAIRK